MTVNSNSPVKRKRSVRAQDARIAWLLVSPSLLVILGVTLWPIISTFILSFFVAPTGINQARTFVGFGNYLDMLRDPAFWETIQRTLYFTVVSVGLELILGLAIAQLIHSRPWGWKFLRFSLIIPWVVPTIVNGAMWRWIYSADFGALNGILFQLGLIDHYVPWLTLSSAALNLVIIADLWHTVPFVALILQAALAALPEELNEAAAVDGANAFQRFWRIRLPLLRPAILVALIVRTVEAFRVFDIVYIITGGGPASKTITISYLTYLYSFSYGKQGTGAALSFLISIFTIIIAIFYIRFLYRPEDNTVMKVRKFLRQLVLFLLTLPVLVFIFFPVLWLFSASLSTQVELFTVPPHWIPQQPTFQNYFDIIFPGLAASSVPRTFGVALVNSMKIASAVTFICIVFGSLAAYALVRIPFKFNLPIQIGILGTRMIPEVSLVIPLFIIASTLNLINKPIVLILTYMSFALPYAIWMMAAFFQTVPIELEEAARLDGCSRLGILFRIVMPISLPGLISTTMFVFLVAWDEFFYALIFTSTLAAKTAPVAIAEFIGRFTVNVNGMMAGGILAAVPPVLLALIFQRYIVSGLTAGAVKG